MSQELAGVSLHLSAAAEFRCGGIPTRNPWSPETPGGTLHPTRCHKISAADVPAAVRPTHAERACRRSCGAEGPDYP